MIAVALAVGATACGGQGPRSAVAAHLRGATACRPGRSTASHASTVEGVTTITYYHRGSETTVSVFSSDDDAKQAELAEALLGDAHDRRVGNVLYSGGGAAEEAVTACLE